MHDLDRVALVVMGQEGGHELLRIVVLHVVGFVATMLSMRLKVFNLLIGFVWW